MSEEEILDEIFGGKKWQGKFPIFWCDLCDTYSIRCVDKECTGTSCNCHSCPKCSEAQDDFNKAKTHVVYYLKDEEMKVYEKIRFLKKYINESLKEGEYEINWKRMKQQGRLCMLSEAIFAPEIAASFQKYPEINYGEY